MQFILRCGYVRLSLVLSLVVFWWSEVLLWAFLVLSPLFRLLSLSKWCSACCTPVVCYYCTTLFWYFARLKSCWGTPNWRCRLRIERWWQAAASWNGHACADVALSLWWLSGLLSRHTSKRKCRGLRTLLKTGLTLMLCSYYPPIDNEVGCKGFQLQLSLLVECDECGGSIRIRTQSLHLFRILLDDELEWRCLFCRRLLRDWLRLRRLVGLCSGQVCI